MNFTEQIKNRQCVFWSQEGNLQLFPQMLDSLTFVRIIKEFSLLHIIYPVGFGDKIL